MPRVGKRLKIVNIADPNNEVVEEKTIENITDAQELNMIKEEIENNETNENKIEEKIEEKTEEKIEDIPKPNKKKVNAEYMREYRKLKQEEQKKLKEDLKHKSEIIEKYQKIK